MLNKKMNWQKVADELLASAENHGKQAIEAAELLNAATYTAHATASYILLELANAISKGTR